MAEVARPKKSRQTAKGQDKKKKATTEIKKKESSRPDPELNQELISSQPTKVQFSTQGHISQNEAVSKPNTEEQSKDYQLLPTSLVAEVPVEIRHEPELCTKTASIAIVESEFDSKQLIALDDEHKQFQLNRTKLNSDNSSNLNRQVSESIKVPEALGLPCSSNEGKQNSSVIEPTVYGTSVDCGNISSQKGAVNQKEKETIMRKDMKNPAILTLGEREVVGMDLQKPVTDLSVQLTVERLYPDLPLEDKVDSRTASEKQVSPHFRKLYPEVPCESEIVPFSKEELKIFALGSWIENVDTYTEEFLSVANQDKNDLYELLMNYGRCRKQLQLAVAEQQTMICNYNSIEQRLWTFKDEQLTIQGVCADQAKVAAYYRFQTVEMNNLVLGELKRALDIKADHLHQTMALHAYTSVVSRLQVESYIYRLLNSSPTFRAVAVLQKQVDQELDCSYSDLQLLKESISVLFSFTRRIIEDNQFHSDILLWLQKLVAVLHRVGSSADHLFLLNHILRCPAGASKWAAPFVQIEVFNNSAGIFLFMQALALLLSPIKFRSEFLVNMKPCDQKSQSTPTEKKVQNWTLLDEAGEEDVDPDTSWLLLSEDDLITLLSQFPFDELFKQLLGITIKGEYCPEKSTCHQMMKIIGFASSLMEILALGLETFNRARYRQLVKRIGQMIRRTICYVSDHWAQFATFHKEHGIEMDQFYSLEKLQVEFDELFLRAVLHVLKAKRLGIWLFMSEMPFETLSKQMIWKLFYSLHCVECENIEGLCAKLHSDECKIKLKDPEHKEMFEQCLSNITSSDGICLLTTFAHMTHSKKENVDQEFVKIVALEIYEVAYVSPSTRESFSKVGRELLATISLAHPHVISILLDRVQESIDKVGMVSLYLFKELPLHLWKITSAEMSVIRGWLLNHNLSAAENKLACIILEGLNWGLDEEQTKLALDPSLHTEVALMVLEAYQKYLTDKPYSGFISESLKQVSYLANVVRLTQTPEALFNHWAWELVVKLKLCSNHPCSDQGWPPGNNSFTAPEMNESPALHPLFKAVKSGIPIGCYLALSMTSIGHSVEKFCSEGISLLEVLVQSKYLKAVVHVLDKILPIFYPCQYYLLKNEQFLSSLQLFLQTDSVVPQGMTQQMTQRVAQHLTGISYGENIKLLNSMIQTHLVESSKPGRVGIVDVLEFWIQIFTNQHLWYRDKTVLFLMDNLCKTAFLHQQEDCLQKSLYQQHKNALGYHNDRGLLTSFMSWMLAGNITPSFIEGNATAIEVWFSWIIFNMEAIFEEDSQLRRYMELELISNSSITPDQALKKAQSHLKLPVVPSIQRLMIYRWAHQALVTPSDHPLLPLIWQKFFVLYLRRPGPEFGLPVSGCIGKRYFHSASHSTLLKEMKKRLVEIADFHHEAGKALRIWKKGHSSEDASSPDESLVIQRPESMTSPELHRELLRLFHVFTFWLEDINLQRNDLYLPSLPVQYDAHRLAKVMQNQQDLWTEYVDSERIKHELHETMNLWIQLHSASSVTYRTSSVNNSNPLSAKDQIFNDLKTRNAPVPAVPLHRVKAPVPDIVCSSLTDKKAAIELVWQYLNILQQQAKIAAHWESQQVALDSEVLETWPELYSNREEQITMKLECRGSSSNRTCQGATNVHVKCKQLYEDNAVKQQLDALIKDSCQLQTNVAQPPPQNIAEAAVYVENLITALVNAFKLHHTESYQKVGIALFYEIVSFVCDETQRHPPTRQFFTSCIEILGQVFLSCAKTESKTILKKVLENRRLCNLLSPYFTPNISPDEYVILYGKVVKVLHTENGDIIFMLLTKFDLMLWLNSTKPSMNERTQLLELIHLGLTLCGLQPEDEIQMAFNVLCKHWMYILQYQFPDHYSDFLRFLMQSSSEQKLNPDCWKIALKTLNCTSEVECEPRIMRSAETRCSQNIILSFQQVQETIHWLSDFFYKLRLSKTDLRSFGLFSKWTPYMNEVKKFLMFLAKYFIDSEISKLFQETEASNKNVPGLQLVYAKLLELFKPWLLVLNAEKGSNNQSYPWLEIDTPIASGVVKIFTKCVDYLHQSCKDKLIPGHRGALWFHLMYYCETSTTPKMPEYILYTYHSEYSKLPWRELYPDQALMEEFFKVERGSPKSCFLFLGALLCEVNWVNVLSDAWNPQPLLHTRTMVVYLLFMIVFLSKEDELTSKPESPLYNLLGQTSALPWHFVDIASYQNVLSYFKSHYSPSVVILKEPSAELILKLLKVVAGFSDTVNIHNDATHKCKAFVCQVVQCLVTLDQNTQIVHAQLEHEMIVLLDDIVLFNPPEVDSQLRHMAITSLFMEVLMMLNNISVTSSESLRISLRSWIETKVHYNLALPLLTAVCQSVASVKHMAEMTEASIMAYFKDGAWHDQYFGWGPILVSLQVPELTAEEFLKECIDLESYLTLYVYILQHLNMEQTLSNEMKMLVLLNKWIDQVFPSSANDEVKLFLWWHKLMQLALIQLEQNDATRLELLTRILNALQVRQSHLAEERLSSGILGAIGLGRKSPLSNRFRVVARSMSAFLLVQLPSENCIRLKPGAELQLSLKAQQALNVLETMSLSKQYADYQEEISQAKLFIKNPNYCLWDGNKLLTILINFLYPNTHYLDIIR
ncbi:ectopic P granules protein 5 homolog isoform X1 [Rhinoraja longicauda]